MATADDGPRTRQLPVPEPGAYEALDDLRSGRYVTALARLRAAHVSLEKTPIARSYLVWALNAMDAWGEAWPLVPPTGPLHADPSALVDPVPPVAEAMRCGRVVVLMEGHAFPETRYLGARLLPALREAGATHLAFEASFQAPLDRCAAEGRVTPAAEPYAFDPARALLLRTAIGLGLRLVAFDHPPGGGPRTWPPGTDWEAMNRQREEDMARNVAAILAGDPRARIVVWTGEQHAMKRTPPWSYWPHATMGAHLARLLPQEPYCVLQQVKDGPALAGGPRALTGHAPVLDDLGADAIVYHHRGSEGARPAWLDAGRATVPVAADGAALVQALPDAEGPEAVPVEQQLVHAGARSVDLHLPPGRYRLRGSDATDRVLWERIEDVEATA